MSYFALCNKRIMSLSSMEDETASVEDLELKAQVKQASGDALEKLKLDHENQIQDLVNKQKKERLALEKQILEQNSQLFKLKSKQDNKINLLEGDSERMEAKNVVMRGSNKRSRGNQSKDLVPANGEISSVEEELRKQESLALDLERRLKRRDEEKSKLERKMQNLSKKCENQTKNIKRLLADIKANKVTIEKLRKAAAEGKKASESADKLRSKADQLSEENESLKQLTIQKNGRIEELEKKISDLSTECKSLKDELEDLQQGDIYNEVDGNEMDMVSEGEDIVAEEEEEEDDGLTELERAQVRILDLEEQVEDLQERIDIQLEEKEETGPNNSAENKELIDENKRLLKLKEDADSLEGELMKEIDNLTKDNEKLTGALDDAKSRLKPLEKQVAQLQGDLLATSMKLESFSNAAAGGGVNVDKYVKQIRTLRTQNAEMKTKIRNLENDFEQLENKARREESISASLQEKIDELEEERIMLDERLKSLTSELEESSTNSARLMKQIADLKS